MTDIEILDYKIKDLKSNIDYFERKKTDNRIALKYEDINYGQQLQAKLEIGRCEEAIAELSRELRWYKELKYYKILDTIAKKCNTGDVMTYNELRDVVDEITKGREKLI